jgi:membrane protein DedA with SNARE-associated domain
MGSMHGVIPFLLRHGYWVLFVNVFAEQVGLPAPAFPILLAMGALSGLGNFSFAVSLFLAVCACLSSDLLWFWLGHTRGHSILNLLCRVSLEPDSCVSNTTKLFTRLGARALLIAKFVPGLGATAAPLAGLTRMPMLKFLSADVAGASLWSATYLTVGYIFRDQLEVVGEQAQRMGSWLLVVCVSLLAAYISLKYYQRTKFLRELRIARVTPEALMKMITSGTDVVVVDLRRTIEVEVDKTKLPGAIWIDLDDLDNRYQEIPADKEVILYCS